MPLATLFIGGVLPAQLGSLIRKRRWLYEIQPVVEKFNLKLNKKKAASFKQQAMLDNIGEYGIYNCV